MSAEELDNKQLILETAKAVEERIVNTLSESILEKISPFRKSEADYLREELIGRDLLLSEITNTLAGAFIVTRARKRLQKKVVADGGNNAKERRRKDAINKY